MLIKLSGIRFNSKRIIEEEAKNRPIASSEAKVPRPASSVFSDHLADENYQSKLPIGSAKKTFSKTVNPSTNSSNTLLFTNSIAKGICMYEFSQFIKNSKATMLNFPGPSSHQMLHYLDVHLKCRQINADAIHVGITDILRDNSQSNIDGGLQNIKNMSLKCKKIGIKSIFISGSVYATRIKIVIFEKIHFMIQSFARNAACLTSITETYEESICTKMVYYLMEEDKIILPRNFIFCLNKGSDTRKDLYDVIYMIRLI